MQAALAWLLRRAPNILLIPGTASLAHLRESSRRAVDAVAASLGGIGRDQRGRVGALRTSAGSVLPGVPFHAQIAQKSSRKLDRERPIIFGQETLP